MTTTFKRTLSALAASVGAIAIVSVGSTATLAAAPDVFTVTALTTDNAVYTDANSEAGDDDGFLGVTGTKFIFSGDVATVAYNLSDMGDGYITDVDNAANENNWIFSDLKTQTSYFYVADQLEGASYELTGFQPLDETGDVSGSIVSLSSPITIDNQEEKCTIFASGYGRSAIWDGCLGVIYDIELPTGVVTTVNDAATFADYETSVPLLLDWYEVANSVSQIGIVEYDGSALHVLAVGRTENDYPLGIYRYSLQDAAALPTEILSFGEDLESDYVDLWKFTASPATGQWCAGVESGWEAISGDENINELAFCASASFSTGVAPVPPAPVEPVLAATGLDLTGALVASGVVLLGGASLLLLARRRAAN